MTTRRIGALTWRMIFIRGHIAQQHSTRKATFAQIMAEDAAFRKAADDGQLEGFAVIGAPEEILPT